MAHSCPECGYLCHCGGDIDDCCLEGTPEESACAHCLFRDDLNDDWMLDDDLAEPGKAQEP